MDNDYLETIEARVAARIRGDEHLPDFPPPETLASKVYRHIAIWFFLMAKLLMSGAFFSGMWQKITVKTVLKSPVFIIAFVLLIPYVIVLALLENRRLTFLALGLEVWVSLLVFWVIAIYAISTQQGAVPVNEQLMIAGALIIAGYATKLRRSD